MKQSACRSVDPLGRYVIPADIREKMGLHPGDRIDACLFENKLILQKANISCFCCGKTESLRSIEGKLYLCTDCLKKAKEYMLADGIRDLQTV